MISFSKVWVAKIVICFWPGGAVGTFGATSGSFISISENILIAGNTAIIAGTIVHEMAHWAGAKGGTSTDAEDALGFCGFSDVQTPHLPG